MSLTPASGGADEKEPKIGGLDPPGGAEPKPCCGGAETTAHFKDVRDRFARASSKLNGAPQKRAEDLHRQAAELVEALAKPH